MIDSMSKQEVKVSLVIGGSNCAPEEITASLGIEPTRIYRKGESKIVGSPPRELPMKHKESVWILDAPDNDADIERKLEWLANKLSDRAEAVKRITEKCPAEVSIVIYSGDANPGLRLSSQLLMKIADLGLDVDVDLYYMGEDL